MNHKNMKTTFILYVGQLFQNFVCLPMLAVQVAEIVDPGRGVCVCVYYRTVAVVAVGSACQGFLGQNYNYSCTVARSGRVH